MSEKVYFVVTTYNQEKYIRDAVHSAFTQNFSPLTIIISDDFSTDATFDIVQQEMATYTGQHRLICRQSRQNLGLAKHVNELIDFINQDIGNDEKAVLIVGAAGDDISLPERTSVLYERWKQLGFADVSLFSAMQTVAKDGNTLVKFYEMDYSKEKLTATAFAHGTFSVYGCTQAFTKGLFDAFGPLCEKVVHEDAVIPFRAALLGGVHYIKQSLVCYRRTPESAWKAHSQRTNKDAKLQFLRHASGNVAVAENQLRDLQQFLRTHHSTDYNAMECKIKKKLQHYRYEQRLAEASSHMKRIVVILKAIQEQIPVRKIIKWVSIFYMPSFYQYITLRQVKRKKNHA